MLVTIALQAQTYLNHNFILFQNSYILSEYILFLRLNSSNLTNLFNNILMYTALSLRNIHKPMYNTTTP